MAKRFDVQWNDVYAAVKSMVRYGLRHRDLSGIRALGVDEVSVAKGKLWTVVYHIDEGSRRLLWIGKDRKAESHAMTQAGLAPLLRRLRWTLLKHRRNWTAGERGANARVAQLRTAQFASRSLGGEL